MELGRLESGTQANKPVDVSVIFRSSLGYGMTDHYLANVNHEVRTLLSAMFAGTNLLEDTLRGQSESLELVRVIRRNGNHLLSLLDNALDLSKLDAGKVNLRESRCDLPDLICEIHALMLCRAREKGLGLDVRCASPIPRWIMIDGLRLRQILLNLLANAIHSTHEGHIGVSLSWGEPTDGQPTFRVEVRDTGPGIAECDQERIFEPFVQLREQPDAPPRGTGLGLTISRRITDLMGGSLALESTLGEGSAFTLTLHPRTASERRVDRIALLSLEESLNTSALTVRPPARLTGVDVALNVQRSDLRLGLSVMLKAAGARLTLADDDPSPAAPNAMTAHRSTSRSDDLSPHVRIVEIDAHRTPSADVLAEFRTAPHGVMIVCPPGITPAAIGPLKQAGIECLIEPLNARQTVNAVARAAAAYTNRSAG